MGGGGRGDTEVTARALLWVTWLFIRPASTKPVGEPKQKVPSQDGRSFKQRDDGHEKQAIDHLVSVGQKVIGKVMEINQLKTIDKETASVTGLIERESFKGKESH